MSEDESVGDIENDLEIILDGDQANTEGQAEEVNAEGQENAESETKKEVKPKRVIKNPQPKLNEQTLKGPKGLAAIESYFERVKFKGRGHEEQDLNVLLKTYEYWCHRLFPKFPFDSCITRLEKLGTKRATQTQVKKIRLGLNFEEVEKAILSEEELNATGGFVDSYNDQFDQLVSTAEPEPEISEEQLERIRLNMERAKRLREEKLRKNSENIQSLVDIQQMDTQDTESSVNVTCNDNSDEKQVEDNEDDIENILDYINADNITHHTENASSSNNEFKILEITNCQNSPDDQINNDDILITEIENNEPNLSKMDPSNSSLNQLETMSTTDGANDCTIETREHILVTENDRSCNLEN